MSRKLPVCAFCGEAMTTRPIERVLIEYAGIKGWPRLGWHMDCSYNDKAFQELNQTREADNIPVIEDILAAIKLRGANRVLEAK
jgi:hypothetical protein